MVSALYENVPSNLPTDWSSQPEMRLALAETYGTPPPVTHTIGGEGAPSFGQLTTHDVFDWQGKGEGVYIRHFSVLAPIERKDRTSPWRRLLMTDYRGSQKWFWLAAWSGLRAAAPHQKHWCRLLCFTSSHLFIWTKQEADAAPLGLDFRSFSKQTSTKNLKPWWFLKTLAVWQKVSFMSGWCLQWKEKILSLKPAPMALTMLHRSHR